MPRSSMSRVASSGLPRPTPRRLRTLGRVLDHIGFDVKDLQAFIKKIEAEGIKLDEPYRKNAATGNAITYITDPWGTRVELVQRAPSTSKSSR